MFRRHRRARKDKWEPAVLIDCNEKVWFRPPDGSFEFNRQTLPRGAFMAFFVSSLDREDSLTGQSGTNGKIQDAQAVHGVLVFLVSRASLSIYETLRPEQHVPFLVCNIHLYVNWLNSSLHANSLTFFILHRFCWSNMNVTEHWSALRVKCLPLKNWDHLRVASIMAQASFSWYFSSWLFKFRTIYATGRPSWDNMAAMA